MTLLRGAHWRAPTWILTTFFLGCIVTLAHHLLYSNLQHTAVPSQKFTLVERNFSRQQPDLFLGTSISHLVKVLCLSVSVSYVQVFWYDLLTQKRAPTIGDSGCNSARIIETILITPWVEAIAASYERPNNTAYDINELAFSG